MASNVEIGVHDVHEDVHDVQPGRCRGHPMAFMCTCIAICGSYIFGVSIGYSSPTQSAIIRDFGLSTHQFSLFCSMLTFGAMIGAITSGAIADFAGRKWAMRVYAVICAAGWLTIYMAKSFIVLDVGRVVGGYGIGAFSYVVPVYVAEIAPVHLRGTLATLHQVMISTGVSATYLLGILLSWRTLALTGAIPCAIFLFGLFLIPESPRWLAKRGAEDRFKASLQKLRGNKADITDEAAEINDCIRELDQLPKTKILDLLKGRYIRPFTFGGVNGIFFYISKIFEAAGFSPRIGTIVFALLQVVVSSIGATLIDKAGRKPLLLVSAVGLVFGCILSAVAFYLMDHAASQKTAGKIAAAGLLVCITAYSVGMGPVPWVIMSEIFPMNVKGLAGSVATLVTWIGAWAVSYSFNFMMEWSLYGTFILYAAVNALTIVFVVTVVPETKGKTLEQIQVAINK